MVADMNAASQHAHPAHAPRPMPLFLDMVRRVAEQEPELAARALAGVRVYEQAFRLPRSQRSAMARHGRATLTRVGEAGPIVVLVPSLINPSRVLDLREGRSLLDYLGNNGFRAMLLDWGAPSQADDALDVGGHVEELLVPLLDQLGEPVHLVGYCLGGTMAMAAAATRPVRSLSLLAAPWHFGRYPDSARSALADLWHRNHEQVRQIGLLPVELLQTAFWSLDPRRTVTKYAALAEWDPSDPHVVAFAALEDWANEGAPLTAAAGEDLFANFIGGDVSGQGRWRVGGKMISPSLLTGPAMQFVAHDDRIAPAETACDAVPVHRCPSGHVGMIVGSAAEDGCWSPLREWLQTGRPSA